MAGETYRLKRSSGHNACGTSPLDGQLAIHAPVVERLQENEQIVHILRRCEVVVLGGLLVQDRAVVPLQVLRGVVALDLEGEFVLVVPDVCCFFTDLLVDHEKARLCRWCLFVGDVEFLLLLREDEVIDLILHFCGQLLPEVGFGGWIWCCSASWRLACRWHSVLSCRG